MSKILRVFRTLLVFFSLFLLLALWGLRSSAVQNWLVPYAENIVSEALGAKVEIGYVDIALPSSAVLANVSMDDQQGQALFKLNRINLGFSSFSILNLIFNRDDVQPLRLSRAVIIGPEAHFYRKRSDSLWNFEFLSVSSSSDSSANPIKLELDFPNVQIRSGKFSMIDSTLSDSALRPSTQINFFNLGLQLINADVAFKMDSDNKLSGTLQNFSCRENNSKQSIEEIDSEYLIDLSPESESHLSMSFQKTKIRIGRTLLDFDGQLDDIRRDSSITGFYPVFQAQFRKSDFDFATLGKLFPKPLPIGGPLQIEGFVSGDLSLIHSDSLLISMFEHTKLKTAIDLRNYTSASALRFDLDIDNGQVSFEELMRLLPETDIPLRGIARLNGKVNGSLTSLRAPALRIRYLENTDLDVDVRLFNYTNGDDLLMDIKFAKSKFDVVELRKLIPSMELPEWLGKFGVNRIDGHFIGGVNDFVIDADVGSKFGLVQANLHLQLPPKVKEISYDGWLNTSKLNFEALGDILPVQSKYLNFEGKIKGSGVNFGTMVADIDGKLTASDIGGYHIDQVLTENLKIVGRRISGGVAVVDEEGGASVTVDLNLGDTLQSFFVVGDLKKLNLAHYGIFPSDSMLLSGIVNVDFQGRNIENYTGKLRLLEALLTREKRKDSLSLKNIVLSSKLDSKGRHLVKLASSIADMSLTGAFTYKQAIDVGKQIATEAKLYIKNNDSLINAYYDAKIVDPQDFKLNDTIKTKAELNRIFAFFDTPLWISPGTELRLSFDHGVINDLGLEITSDSISYGTIGFKADSVFLSVQKDASQNYLLGQAYAFTDRLSFGQNLHFDHVSFEPTADDKEVDYFLRASQPEIGNEYVLSAQTNFMDNGEIRSQIRSNESKIIVRNQIWKFAGNNSIDLFFSKPPSLAKIETDSIIPRYHIKGIKLYSEGQAISLGGYVSKDKTDLMNIDIRNLSLRNVLEILDQPIDLDGEVKLATFGAWNLLSDAPSIYGSGEIIDFRYQKVDSIGIRFKGGYPSADGPDFAGLRLEAGHWGQDSVIMKGWYNLANTDIHFDADSSSIQLSWAEPFLTGILSDLSGKVALDKFSARGKLSKPILTGKARLKDTKFKVDYFNNVFLIGDNVLTFDNKKISLDNILLRDTLNGSGLVNGAVYYNDTSGIKLDLAVNQLNDLLFMDTRAKDNDLFYGHLVLDGDSAHVGGTLLSPIIEASVNSGDNSWLDIPISSYTSANRLDFVNFVNHGDTSDVEETKITDGMKMTITANAQKNTRVRLIFDEFAGDIIEAWGEGAITLATNEAGDFSMFGTYVLDRGDYHFTLQNVLNKKFVVAPGGRIIWTGDPFDAQVDLDAVYKVSADISSLLPNSGSGANRIPVEIVMHMKGSLMQPEIDLELKLDQLSDQDVLGLASYFRGIQYDEQELNKQVVSLLMFRRFTSNSSYFQQGSTAANVTSSISELISNQVNNWISQAFTDPKIGVEVNSNEFQDVELALKASLFNDRVTVERNGTIIGNTSSNVSIGDLSVLIKVLPRADSLGRSNPRAGQMVIEVFNREDASFSNTANISRGTGVFYKKDFDRLKDLIETRRKNQKKAAKENASLSNEND